MSQVIETVVEVNFIDTEPPVFIGLPGGVEAEVEVAWLDVIAVTDANAAVYGTSDFNTESTYG